MAAWQVTSITAIDERLALACFQRLHNNLRLLPSRVTTTISFACWEWNQHGASAGKHWRPRRRLRLVHHNELLRRASIRRNSQDARPNLAEDDPFLAPADGGPALKPTINRDRCPAIQS